MIYGPGFKLKRTCFAPSMLRLQKGQKQSGYYFFYSILLVLFIPLLDQRYSFTSFIPS